MRLGYHTGYWSAGPPPGAQEAVLRAEELGFDSAWTAEAYGSDAFTPLAWWGARTTHIRLGTAIAQLSARTPTATAMAAITLDHLSHGRVTLGLGASGPQVVEGWYGQPYPRPLARTREYVAIIRDVVRRESPVTSTSESYRLPYAGSADRPSTGLGKPLRSTVHPLRTDLPIHLAAEGPKNIALAAEIADGWLPLFYSPRMDATYRELLADGFARRAPGLSAVEDFEVSATVPVVVHDDVERAADVVRPFIALYAGGMGARGANFHRAALDRLGYTAACDEIQAHFLAGDRARAAAAVPLELVQDVAIVGPPAAIRAALPTWESTAITTLIVQAEPESLPELARLLG